MLSFESKHLSTHNETFSFRWPRKSDWQRDALTMQIGGCVIQEGGDSRNPWLSRFVFVEKTPCSKLGANDPKWFRGVESEILYLPPPKNPNLEPTVNDVLRVEKISDYTFHLENTFMLLSIRGWISPARKCLLLKSGIVGCTENMESTLLKPSKRYGRRRGKGSVTLWNLWSTWKHDENVSKVKRIPIRARKSTGR